jgi:hypothetical protein
MLCTVHRGSTCIALLFLNHGTRRGWGVSIKPWPLSTLGKDLVPIAQEAGWAPGLVRTGAENLAPTGIRSPDRPACSQSLYRLRYLAHKYYNIMILSSHGNITVYVVRHWPKCGYGAHDCKPSTRRTFGKALHWRFLLQAKGKHQSRSAVCSLQKRKELLIGVRLQSSPVLPVMSQTVS